MKIKQELVSVVIPTYNRKKMVERLIRSVVTSDYKNIEVIVVDDYSTDETYKYLEGKFKKNKKIKIHRNSKNLFTAESRNIGQGLAKGKYYLFIDDDNVLDKKMISNLVLAFKSDKTIGQVGPVNYNFNKKRLILWTKSTRNMSTTKTNHSKELGTNDLWETDDIPNSFMVRKDIVVKNKIKFKKRFGIMYEESDYAYRIKKAGFKVMVAKNAKIYHDIEISHKGKKTKDYMYHFMEDIRRPFVFARNRIIFHVLYSTRSQLIQILLFWIWFFNLYYIYKILFYSGYGQFSLSRRIELSLAYLSGTLEGLKYAREKI